MKCIKISTSDAVSRLTAYLQKCDGDELARLLSDCFGGQCFQSPEDPDIYNFEPNKFYGGEFKNEI